MNIRKGISLLLLICVSVNSAWAECDFSLGVKSLPNGNYEYSKDCHVRVGQLVQSNDTKDRQIVDLNQAIQLKDLAIKRADERTALWMDTSFKLEERLNKVHDLQSRNQWLFFSLGVVTTALSVFVATKAIGH